MSFLRFHHVFFTLMLLALISAFLLKPEQSAAFTPQIQVLFAPIVKPADAVGRMIAARVNPPVISEKRSVGDLVIQNEQLTHANLLLKARVEQLEAIEAIRETAGQSTDQQNICQVIGRDSSGREALSINGSSHSGIAIGQPVTYDQGIAGRIVQAGLTGAKVQLITDVGAPNLTAKFARFVSNGGSVERQQFLMKPTLIHGVGENKLSIDFLTRADVTQMGVVVGDYVLLADAAWPNDLQGDQIGKVVSIAARPDSPLFARIIVQPPATLAMLKQVSVITK